MRSSRILLAFGLIAIFSSAFLSWRLHSREAKYLKLDAQLDTSNAVSKRDLTELEDKITASQDQLRAEIRTLLAPGARPASSHRGQTRSSPQIKKAVNGQKSPHSHDGQR